jgi:signal transduction histidine kinase
MHRSPYSGNNQRPTLLCDDLLAGREISPWSSVKPNRPASCQRGIQRIARFVGILGRARHAVHPVRLLRNHGFSMGGAAIVALIFSLAGVAVWNSRQHAFQERERDATNLAIALAEQTSRYVQTVDLTMMEAKSWINGLDAFTPATFKARMKTRAIHQGLVERRPDVLQGLAIEVVAADGDVLNASRAELPSGLNIGGRDFYEYLKSHDDSAIIVGSPTNSLVTGKPCLFFATRMNSADGTFLGLVVGVVDAAYFSNFYRSISERMQGTVSLLRSDGRFLVRYPNLESAVGRQVPSTSPWFSRVAAGGGYYRSTGYIDAVASAFVVQPLRDYPLVVDVELPEDALLAPWRRQTTYIVIVVLVISIGLIAVMRVIAAQLMRQRQHNGALNQAAADLIASERKLRVYAEMSADWFWEQGADLRFLDESKIPLTTLSTDIGKTRWDIADSAMSPQRWDPHKADLAAQRPFRDFRWERIRTDGKRGYLSTSGDPIFDGAGMFLGYQGTGRDITADVEAAEELRLAKERAESASRAKSEFLANMSHELRTPLHAIIGFSELIHDHRIDRTGGNHTEWADAILSCGRHLLDVINNMLELTRIDAGHCELVDDRVSLAIVVRSCLLTIKLKAVESNLRVDCGLAEMDVLIRADGRLVKQVILNLLTNAVKFTPAGGVISILLEHPASGDIVLVVSDTGVGIDPAALPSIFEPFDQADVSIARRFGGTGLGLAISRKLMALHGGTLTIESAVGRGTTVWATFPATRLIARGHLVTTAAQMPAQPRDGLSAHPAPARSVLANYLT